MPLHLSEGRRPGERCSGIGFPARPPQRHLPLPATGRLPWLQLRPRRDKSRAKRATSL